MKKSSSPFLLTIAFLIVVGIGAAYSVVAFQGACGEPPDGSGDCNTPGPVWLQSGSPTQQSGSFSVNGLGKVGTTSGGGSNGDFSFSNDLYFTSTGKSIRVDADGAAVLNIANYDGGTNDSLAINFLRGSLPSEQQVRILTSDNAGGGQICLNGSCISSWPSGGGGDLTAVNAGTGISVSGGSGPTPTVSLNTSYTDGRYVNVTGDIMSGELNIGGFSPISGTALEAYGTSYGVYTEGDVAVHAWGDDYGVMAQGGIAGISAQKNSSNYGCMGCYTDGVRAVGQTSGIDGNGGTQGGNFYGGTYGIYAAAPSYAVYGVNSNSNYGYLGSSSFGVYGRNGDNYAYLGASSDAFFAFVENGSNDYGMGFNSSGLRITSGADPNLRFGGIGGGGCAGWSGIEVSNTSESSSSCDNYIFGSNANQTEVRAPNGNLNLVTEGGEVSFYVNGSYMGAFYSGGLWAEQLTSSGMNTSVCVDSSGGSHIGRCASSIRYKKDVKDLTLGLDDVLQLRPRTFVMKADPDENVDAGLIAEEVERVAPLLVRYDEKGQPDGLSYNGITAMLVNAVQDLKKENDGLRAELDDLRGRMDRLERGE